MIERRLITDRKQWLEWRREDVTNSDIARFEDKYIPEPNSGCWLWIGALVPDGYGSFYWGKDSRHSLKAHRASWIIYRGPLDAHEHVLHSCDIRSCVNPTHLFVGDNAANVADRITKGRSAVISGAHNPNWKGGISLARGTIGRLRGEAIGNAKLNETIVRDVRYDCRSTHVIASSLGVSQTLISLIKRRKVWRHVD